MRGCAEVFKGAARSLLWSKLGSGAPAVASPRAAEKPHGASLSLPD